MSKNFNDNSNINIIQNSYEVLNSTNSFSSNYEKNRKHSDNNLFDINFNTSYIFYDNNNNQNNKKNNSLINYRNQNFSIININILIRIIN